MSTVTNKDTITPIFGNWYRVNNHRAYRRFLESVHGIRSHVAVKGSPLSYPCFVNVKHVPGELFITTRSRVSSTGSYKAKTCSAAEMERRLRKREYSNADIDRLLQGM